MSNRTSDANGFVEIRRNPISRAGVFPYKGRSISPDLDPEKVYWVYRPPEELSNEETITSFRLLPWTDTHPATLLGASADQSLTDPDQKGVRGVIGENVEFDHSTETLYANIKVFSPSMARAIELGKRELSSGMRCKYVREDGVAYGQAYQFRQIMLRGNHLSSVEEGRVGPDIAVLDHLNFSFDAKEISIMEPDETTGGDASKMTLDQVVEMLDSIAPQLAKINEAMAALKKADPEKVEDVVKEKVEEEIVVDKDDTAKDPATALTPGAATDADADKDKTIAAMDAQIKGLKAELSAYSPTSVMSAIAARDRMASQVSHLVGAFDHSEMTAEDVAKYGLKKVGIAATAGNAIASWQAYAHGRTPTQVTFAMDSQDRGASKVSALDNHLKGA